MNEWIIKIVDVGYKTEKDIYIFKRTFDGKTQMLDGSVLNQSQELIKPTISLTDEQLEKLVNEITKKGISPQKEYIQGKLEATENHLKDVRTLLKLK